MNNREHYLMLIAEDEASETYDDLSTVPMDEWARIYDDVDNDFQKYDVNRLREYIGADWGDGPFSLSAWVAESEFDCDDTLSGEDWAKLDDYVVRHLAPFTTGALFQPDGRRAHGSGGGGAALAQ